jgi:hypothetical protein
MLATGFAGSTRRAVVLMVEGFDNLRGLWVLYGRGGFEGPGRLHHSRAALPAAMLLSQRIEALAILPIALIWRWILLHRHRGRLSPSPPSRRGEQ